MIVSGFALSLIFVLAIDAADIIPFHKFNLLRLSNPIKFMGMHTFEMEKEISILLTLKTLLQAALGHYDISAKFNEEFNPTILHIDTKIFLEICI